MIERERERERESMWGANLEHGKLLCRLSPDTLSTSAMMTQRTSDVKSLPAGERDMHNARLATYIYAAWTLALVTVSEADRTVIGNVSHAQLYEFLESHVTGGSRVLSLFNVTRVQQMPMILSFIFYPTTVATHTLYLGELTTTTCEDSTEGDEQDKWM